MSNEVLEVIMTDVSAIKNEVISISKKIDNLSIVSNSMSDEHGVMLIKLLAMVAKLIPN